MTERHIHIEESTVHIGLEQPVTILHLSDTHFCEADEQDSPAVQGMAARRLKNAFLDTDGVDRIRQYWDESVAYAKEHNLPIIRERKQAILTGDSALIAEQKKAGRIRHLGLSCHSSIGTLKRFVSKYREHLEFCQIQLNYLDYEFQNARDKVEYLNEAGLPVWVMEGLRGGKLAKSCLGAEEQLAKINADYTPANWGFAYLESVPGVTMILSGMSTVEQLQQNIEFFDSRKPLDDEAVEILYSAARRDAQRKGTVPCTACRYCTPNCPMNLPIPDLFAEFNEYIYKEKTVIPRKAMEEWPAEMWPTNCIGCGACAAVCPQQIDIPGTMSKFADMIEA